MEASIQTLLSRLVTGPTFLLLGQKLDESGDVRSGRTAAVPAVAEPQGDLTANYERLDRELRAEPVPAWLSEIAQYPWNGVFTSRIDSLLPDVFSCDWRRVVPTAQAQLGRHPRSATELQLRYLFGGLGLPEDERPPADMIQEAETRARVAETLNTLADTLITPRGAVVIEGYDLDDWLTPQELFTFVTRLQAGQAHLFSAWDALREDPFVRAAIDRGVLSAQTHLARCFPSLRRLAASSGLRPGGAWAASDLYRSATPSPR